MNKFSGQETQYGFKWGPAEVIRCASHPKWGVMLDLETTKQRLEIRVTPSGIIRVGKAVKRLP